MPDPIEKGGSDQFETITLSSDRANFQMSTTLA
jgi:hypothetical protein